MTLGDSVDGPSKKKTVTQSRSKKTLASVTGERGERAAKDPHVSPAIQWIDPEERKFTFVKQQLIESRNWNFFQIKFMTWSNSTMLLNQILDSKNDEFWIWELNGIDVDKPLGPFSNDPTAMEFWVGDRKGPFMKKIPEITLDFSKKQVRTCETIPPGDTEADRLSTIIAANEKKSPPEYTWGLHLETSDGPSIHAGASTKTMYVLDDQKNKLDLRTSFDFSKMRSAGGSVAPVGQYPKISATADWAKQLAGQQAMGTDMVYRSESTPFLSVETPDRWLGDKTSMGFMLFDDQVGPWVAVQTTDIHETDYLSAQKGGLTYKDPWTFYAKAKLRKVSSNAIGKLVAEMFWRQYGRQGFHIPIPVKNMQRWEPETAQALEEMLTDGDFDIYKALMSANHYQASEKMNGLIFSDDENLRKNVTSHLRFKTPEKELKMKLLMESLMSRRKPELTQFRQQPPALLCNQY